MGGIFLCRVRSSRSDVIAACAAVACFGFLWYNSNPASIFMGDTGSLALGGLFAALSIATHTEFLAVVLGGLYVMGSHERRHPGRYFKMTHNVYSKWRRFTIISNWRVGPKPRWWCGSG